MNVFGQQNPWPALLECTVRCGKSMKDKALFALPQGTRDLLLQLLGKYATLWHTKAELPSGPEFQVHVPEILDSSLKTNSIVSLIKSVLSLTKFLLCEYVNTLRTRQNGHYFADYIFKCIFLNENVYIPIKISLKFVPKGPINNILSLGTIMGWHHPGYKPLSEPMMVTDAYMRYSTSMC